MWNRAPQFRSRRRTGFTLVEVLVTMVMMAIVLPVVMRGISLATNAASLAKHQAEAAQLGDQLLNEMSMVLANGEAFSYGSSGEFADTVYKWQLETADDTETGITTMMLHVIWSERGQDRSLALSTMVSDPLATTTTTTGTTP